MVPLSPETAGRACVAHKPALINIIDKRVAAEEPELRGKHTERDTSRVTYKFTYEALDVSRPIACPRA